MVECERVAGGRCLLEVAIEGFMQMFLLVGFGSLVG